MANLMDSAMFTPVQRQQPQQPNIIDMYQQVRQDPLAFEEYVKQTNPEGYQRAVQIRNCSNPKAMVLEMMRAQGINPNVVSMLGLK